LAHIAPRSACLLIPIHQLLIDSSFVNSNRFGKIEIQLFSMKSHRLQLLLPFFVLVLVSGCAQYWAGTVNSSVAIPVDKYHVVRSVSGNASTFLFLGLIGGLEHNNLVEEAKSDLVNHTKLDSNQVLGDWSVSFRKQYSIIGCRQYCEVRANVISLVPIPNVVVAPVTLEKPGEMKKPAPPAEEIQQGDSVEFDVSGKKVSGRVLRASSNSLKIRYIDTATKSEQKINRFRKDVLKVK